MSDPHRTLAYGSWPSPVSAAMVCEQATPLREPAFDADDDASTGSSAVRREGGRQVLLRRSPDGSASGGAASRLQHAHPRVRVRRPRIRRPRRHRRRERLRRRPPVPAGGRRTRRRVRSRRPTAASGTAPRCSISVVAWCSASGNALVSGEPVDELVAVGSDSDGIGRRHGPRHRSGLRVTARDLGRRPVPGLGAVAAPEHAVGRDRAVGRRTRRRGRAASVRGRWPADRASA